MGYVVLIIAGANLSVGDSDPRRVLLGAGSIPVSTRIAPRTSSESRKGLRASSKPWKPTPKSLYRDTVFIGDTAYAASDSVLVATSKQVYERLQDLILAGDRDGAAQLGALGLIWVAPKYTRFRAIKDYGWLDLHYEVRVLEGPHQGSIGFLSSGDLRKAR